MEEEFYVFSIGAIVNPLLTSCWWYSSACSSGPLHTSAEPSLSTTTASSHDLFSVIPGIIVTRQFATCSNELKLSSRTIILASGYFLFVVLMSILKGLIKGFDEDQEPANSELLDNNLNENPGGNVVTITLED